MIVVLIIVAIVFLLYLSVCLRIAVCHPFKTVFFAIKDCINYFKYYQWHNMACGNLIAYTALFGRGKTLSVVHYVVGQYKKYNNKRIYDRDRKKWVTQKVHIISNVNLNGIPYEEFVSLSQIVNVANHFRSIDEKEDTLTCILVLGDEFSVQMNSRSFKTNIDPLFLNTLLTCRHHHITLVYDAQRFNHVDALLRQVTSYCVECKKVWRFQVQSFYDAYALECTNDPSLVKPYKRSGWFIMDRDFALYDTLACVGNLKKAFDDGDMLSEEQILANRQKMFDNNSDDILNPSRKFKRVRKKMK